MSALPLVLTREALDAKKYEATTPRATQQKSPIREPEVRSRQDEPFIATIGAKWRCSNVCSWGILTDREVWTLFLQNLINLIRQCHPYYSIVWQHQSRNYFPGLKWNFVLLFCPKNGRRSSPGDCSGGAPSPLWRVFLPDWIRRFELMSFYLIYAYPLQSQRLIFWCPRRRGTTPIHLELGGETLLRQQYCRGGPAEK